MSGGSACNFSPEIGTYKNGVSPYSIVNTATGSPSVSVPMIPTLQGFSQVVPLGLAPTQSYTIPNPPSGGLWAIIMDFGPTYGDVNNSTIAYFDASNVAWFGGAESAIAAGGSVTLAPAAATSANMTYTNNTSATTLPAGAVTIVHISNPV